MPQSQRIVEVLSLTAIEKHALLESRDKRRQVFATYLAMREKVGHEFLPLINSREPYMNDHSVEHLTRVLVNIESILIRNFPSPSSHVVDIPEDSVITWADTLILLNALVWHDAGNIYGRKQHATAARECLTAIAEKLYDTHLRAYILQVAEAHSGKDAIDRLIPESQAAVSYQWQSVHLRFLAAVLRLADEIDEDYRRALPHDWDEMNLIPEENQRFWFFSKCNSSIRIHPTVGDRTLQFWIQIDSHIPRSYFDHGFHYDGSRSVHALTEYFRRILKFEDERAYCNRFLRSAYYHPGIYGLQVSLRTHEPNDAPHTGVVFSVELSENRGLDALLTDPQYSFLQPYMQAALELRNENA